MEPAWFESGNEFNETRILNSGMVLELCVTIGHQLNEFNLFSIAVLSFQFFHSHTQRQAVLSKQRESREKKEVCLTPCVFAFLALCLAG